MTLNTLIRNRETRITEIEYKLYQQQQVLIKLMRQIIKQQTPKSNDLLTIKQVIERFIIKVGKDSEEAKRKYNAIHRYLKEIGLHLENKYSKLHSERVLLKIIKAITARTDIKGDQKVRHVRWIKELIKFATFAYPDTYKTDVLMGLPSLKRTPKNAKKPHLPYSDSQLKSMFNPRWHFFNKYPDMFWGCLIALFTGSRKNAVFTLQYKDIVQKDGIWCINFIEDCPEFKHLKTEDSQRLVPIHSALIKMGFLNYIHKKHNVNQKDFIFKKVCLTANNTLNPHITRKFFVFLEQIGIRNSDSGKYDFHSFRKNANIAMEKCGLLRSYIDKIIGWQSRGSEGERSYSNYTIKQISEQLELLRYDCLKTEFKQWKKIMKTI